MLPPKRGEEPIALWALEKECALTSASVTQNLDTVEAAIRVELTREYRGLVGVAPVLGHMLVNSGNALVSDAIVARVRGMLNDLAHQLISRLPHGEQSGAAGPEEGVDRLADQLAQDAPILTYLHAAAIESVLVERLDLKSSIDPVLTPLWQELVASEDFATGEAAMQALASQSRFLQTQRRMQHPLDELPSEILERVLRIWVRGTSIGDEPDVSAAMRAIKLEYDEAETRLGLISRLVGAMRSGMIAALEIEHAGLALFVTALAQASGQSRELAVLACHQDQAMRLAISLKASGLEAPAVERQLLIFEPTLGIINDVAAISIERARELLSASRIENLNTAIGERLV